MSLIKKADVPKYFAARRASRLASAAAKSHIKANKDAAGEAAEAKAREAEFLKDFSAEHSTE